MRYVFMDNYRGFSETLIPIRKATFLVGENSTGKSSFLALVHMLSWPDWAFVSEYSRGPFGNLGGFRDIVSIASPDRSYFSVGALAINTGKARARTTTSSAFSIMRFCDEEGLPRMNSYTLFSRGRLATVLYKGKKVYYKFEQAAAPADPDEMVALFLQAYRSAGRDDRGFAPTPDNIPSRAPLPLIAGMLSSASDRQAQDEAVHLFTELPDLLYASTTPWTWLAPIRTRPHRIYEGFKTDFTPEGDHTPYVIRKTLDSRDKAKKFASLLARFGESSGLFTGVEARSFGRDPSAPFEVIVGLHGKALNISNVGYGVSQVLPVVVEMVTRPKGHHFAIQQPEVHLHPRAQAALGDLLHFLVVDQEHEYIVETHSDYLIDRFRLRIKESGKPADAQVVFFARTESGNTASILPINQQGQYPAEQPDEFRRFFINEEVSLLEI